MHGIHMLTQAVRSTSAHHPDVALVVVMSRASCMRAGAHSYMRWYMRVAVCLHGDDMYTDVYVSLARVRGA